MHTNLYFKGSSFWLEQKVLTLPATMSNDHVFTVCTSYVYFIILYTRQANYQPKFPRVCHKLSAALFLRHFKLSRLANNINHKIQIYDVIMYYNYSCILLSYFSNFIDNL